jgi:hypothetical protein
MEINVKKPGFDTTYRPGYGTEYTDNYNWKEYYASRELNRDIADHLVGDGSRQRPYKPTENDPCPKPQPVRCCVAPKCDARGRDPAVFSSDEYPCVYRELRIIKDDRDRYIDPFRLMVAKPDGRRLLYDPTHPHMIYGSQWSSELADPPGPYSFPVPVGFDAEIPWKKDLQWQVESEVGKWPTNRWKEWTKVAACPTYDGYDDQVKYSQYTVPAANH